MPVTLNVVYRKDEIKNPAALEPAPLGFREDRIIGRASQAGVVRMAKQAPECFEAFSSLTQGHDRPPVIALSFRRWHDVHDLMPSYRGRQI
jgi:hypothetical protein